MSIYDDIINLPHHQSSKRPHMSIAARAAQFSSFEALSGHKDAISETARKTENKIEPDEYEKELIDRELMKIENMNTPLIDVTYFVSDKLKAGGKYVKYTGIVKKLDIIKKQLITEDNTLIDVTNIKKIKIFEKSIDK